MANTANNFQKNKVILGRLLQIVLAMGLVFGGIFLIFYSSRDNLRIKKSESRQVDQIEVKPYKLYIPKIHKILYVSDGVIVDGRWTISTNGVSYLTTSALPGKVGNAVLYGHNLNDVLGYLPNLQNGDMVYVVMRDGNLHKYQIFERSEVKPNQVEILKNTTDSRVTIYTCSGFLDSARFVVVGKLVS